MFLWDIHAIPFLKVVALHLQVAVLLQVTCLEHIVHIANFFNSKSEEKCVKKQCLYLDADADNNASGDVKMPMPCFPKSL